MLVNMALGFVDFAKPYDKVLKKNYDSNATMDGNARSRSYD